MPKKPTSTKTDVEAILERLKALEERIARLEGENDAAMAVAADFGSVASGGGAAAPGDAGRPGLPLPVTQDGDESLQGAAPHEAPLPEVSEEILLVISAAVAAFLGERAHIRQVRLVRSDAWAQQGRVSVMASHRWAVRR